MRKLIAAVALAVMVLAGRPAHAQDSTAVTPARVRAAEEVMQAMDMVRTYQRTLDAMVGSAKEQNPMLAQHEAEFRAFLQKYASWEQMKPDMVRLYAETYTEDELRQLAQFYRTPLGRRLLETMPALSARSAAISQRRVMEHLPELMSTVMGMPPGAAPKP